MRRQTRRAATLFEIIIVVTIMSLLGGIFLPAIQKARLFGMRIRVTNQLKQIALAQQHYTNDRPDGFPGGADSPFRGGGFLFTALLPYLEQQNTKPSTAGLTVVAYFNSADPSIWAYPEVEGTCSFAVNSQLYLGHGTRSEITDGASNTIAFSERYARCVKQGVLWSLVEAVCLDGVTMKRVPCGPTNSMRRATFADDTFTDVLPVASWGGLTTSSIPGVTFQTQPRPQECDPRTVQSTFAGGLLVAYADGRASMVRSSVTPLIFWSSVTPAGGEILPE